MNFSVGLHNSENHMLDWQQTSKDKSLSVDTYIKEVGPRSWKDLGNKIPKKNVFEGTYENSL